MYRPRAMRMTLRPPWRRLVTLASAAGAALIALLASGPDAVGDTPSPAPGAADQPDESLLGTIEVNGSRRPSSLPKMGVVPIVPTGSADSLVNLVVRRDMELSGQFDVLSEDTAPAGPFTHTTPLDLGGWREKGAEYVLRVFAQPAATDSSKTELVGEAYLTPTVGAGGRPEGARGRDRSVRQPRCRREARLSRRRRHGDDRGARGVAPPGRSGPRRPDRAARAGSRAR